MGLRAEAVGDKRPRTFSIDIFGIFSIIFGGGGYTAFVSKGVWDMGWRHRHGSMNSAVDEAKRLFYEPVESGQVHHSPQTHSIDSELLIK